MKNIDVIGDKKWLIVAASVAGRSHTDNNPPIPCQDSHSVCEADGSWGVAVSCDGAGSRRNSHIGAAFVADRAATLFQQKVKNQNWIKDNNLPTKEEWAIFSINKIRYIRKELEQLAKSSGHEVNSLACTLIVVVYSKIGLLVAHVGDGRAGYANKNGVWKPMMNPCKGEEANSTAFITTGTEDILASLIGTTVIDDCPIAFTLMSDGCEHHAYETGSFSPAEQQYMSLNQPYPKFFDPLVKKLATFNASNVTRDEINGKWKLFVERGTERIRNESDDKTLILGVLVE